MSITMNRTQAFEPADPQDQLIQRLKKRISDLEQQVHTLEQQLHSAQQIALEEKEQHTITEQENQLLRKKCSAIEDLLDMDLDDLLDTKTVAPSNSETVVTFSPFDPKRFDTKLAHLKAQYQHTPDLLLDEVTEIARSYCQTLDSNYRRDSEHRERDTICSGIQQHPRLAPAEKDTLIGLVKECYERYPGLDHTIEIQISKFNEKHIGMSEETVSDKIQALNNMGCFDFFKGGEKIEVGDSTFTGPAQIKLNQEKLRNPLSIVKQKPQGGPRKKGCKVPTCPTPEDDVPVDRFITEYHETCDSVHISAAPGTPSTANIKRAAQAIKEGRVFWTEQLENFAETTTNQEKQDAFDLNGEPIAHHIYVDDIKTYETPLPYKNWCHLATDGPIEDLHAFAAEIGLKHEWFQNKKGHPHYDLTPSKRKQAIAHGAIAVSQEELIRACHPRLAAVMDGQKQDAFGQLYEIGYRSPQALDQIDQALAQDDSLMVIDIRYSPASRNPAWTKSAFEKRYGSRYTWLRDLGNINHHEKDNIRIANPEKGITQLTEILKDHSAILLCGCPEYEECHRKTVADLFQQAHGEHKGSILPLTVQANEIRCTTCQIPIQQAEDFYFTEDGTGYCCQHGPQARPQIGQRVATPAGFATITNITHCPILHRLRCSVTTDEAQPDGSHWSTFDISEIHPL